MYSTRGTLLVTGNQLKPLEYIVRRSLVCRLRAWTDRPQDQAFLFEPVSCARERRERLLVAALTILRAYDAAGRPDRPQLSPAPTIGAIGCAVPCCDSAAPIPWRPSGRLPRMTSPTGASSSCSSRGESSRALHGDESALLTADDLTQAGCGAVAARDRGIRSLHQFASRERREGLSVDPTATGYVPHIRSGRRPLSEGAQMFGGPPLPAAPMWKWAWPQAGSQSSDSGGSSRCPKAAFPISRSMRKRREA